LVILSEGTDVNSKPLVRVAAIAGVIALAAMGACGKNEGNDNAAATSTTSATLETTTSTSKPLPGAAPIITESANNSTQTIAYNPSSSEQGSLRINLQTAGGSGYTWEITKQPDPKVVAADAPTQAPTEPRPTTADGTPLVGAPETVSTLLTAVGPGTTSIEMGHIGPAGGAPDQTFKITVVVQ
jgi:chagasin family peptidase inhibitor I42